MPIPMIRDDRDVWEADVPIGTFSIKPGRFSDYSATAHLIFVCPLGHRCSVLIGPTFEDRSSPDRFCVWKWNGDRDRPTLQPSVNCIAEKDGKPTGGCGWHGYITDGVLL
jgi:hypothetical protein